MVVRTPTPGWDAEIYAAASGPPEELDEWGEPVGESPTPARPREIDLDVPAPAKYFLIWFTKAAPARDQDGRYQVEINDVKLIELSAAELRTRRSGRAAWRSSASSTRRSQRSG